MVDASDTFFREKAKIEFNGKTVDATIAVTEGGSPIVDLDKEIPQSSDPDNLYEEIKGTTVSGEDVTLHNVNVVTGFDSGSGYKIRSIKRVQEVVIDGVGNDAFVNEDVKIKFDVLCFMPHYPTTTRPGTFPIIKRNGWGAVAEFVNKPGEREEYIQSRRHPLRTSVITLTQKDQNGPPKVQVEKALSRVENILDIASFLLGVGCSTFRIEVEKDSEKYIQIRESYQNIGSAFTANKLLWGGLNDLVDSAYDWYANDSRNDYKIRNVIGYYLDSINVTRTVEGQLSTLFNGIELIAKRYSDYGPQYASTQKRIEHLVDTLDVEVKDLARSSKVFPDEYVNYEPTTSRQEQVLEYLLPHLRSIKRLSWISDVIERKIIRKEPVPEYFYSKTRQYIVHGDNQSTFDQNYERLTASYEATKVLLQRILRNQLFGQVDESQHPGLGEIEPNEFVQLDS